MKGDLIMRFALALLALVTATAPAHSAVVTLPFSQGGFAGGGQITGFFTGEDLDGNGQISSFAGEITDFGVEFSGNATVSAFALSFDDLFGFVYDLGDPLLGDGRTGDIESILAERDSFAYLAGPEALLLPGACLNANVCGQVGQGGAISDTTSLVFVGVIDAIPEPATWASMILGFALAGTAARGRRKLATA